MGREDAQAAIDMCNGYALNHLILDVSFYEKKTPTRRRLSGYGRYLPQNLKRSWILVVCVKQSFYSLLENLLVFVQLFSKRWLFFGTTARFDCL